MWFEPEKYQKEVKDVNIELAALEGELEDEEARHTLMKFLRRNIGFTCELLTGVKLYPDQIITIKGMLARNNTLCVWGRGVSKTYTAALYCILQCIFEPKTNILLAGPTFRTARFIFNHIEKISESPQAQMLLQACGKPVHRNDEYRFKIGDCEIVAIPLSGEKIRGFRATVLLIDEFLLMPEETVERVLIPFLAAGEGLTDKQKIREREDRLIQLGRMTEAERQVFQNNKKLIALSSASYQCEYLYRKYEEYIKAITDKAPMTEDTPTYFVSQLAWNSVNPDRMDKQIIKLASSNEASSANFRREYGAEFLDGSDSYFSMNKMLACSVPDGQEPTLLLRGEKEKKYILAIDPNFSNSESADFFAMCVIELDDDGKGGAIVHNYAEAGKDLKDHIKYLFYLWTNFNIVMICIDYAGYQFIESANESELFRDKGIELKFFEFESTKDGLEYEEELKKARRNYNQQINKIVFSQYFGTGDFIRKANEWLQGCIDYKKIWFGGSIRGNGSVFGQTVGLNLNADLFDTSELDGNSLMPFLIDKQEVLIKQTRYQCASIEVKISIKGVQTFDLPQVMKRDTGASRMRRDNYTALMLATWAMKCYSDIMNVNTENATATFIPFFV